jgi:hypothetical protein
MELRTPYYFGLPVFVGREAIPHGPADLGLGGLGVDIVEELDQNPLPESGDIVCTPFEVGVNPNLLFGGVAHCFSLSVEPEAPRLGNIKKVPEVGHSEEHRQRELDAQEPPLHQFVFVVVSHVCIITFPR